MFNFVMGIIMIGAGVICLFMGIAGDFQPALVFLGSCLLLFGIVEIIRSKSIRANKARRKEAEMDAYLRMAAEMGVVVNPITKEVVKKNGEEDVAAGADVGAETAAAEPESAETESSEAEPTVPKTE